jgi:hypothetical protein
MAFLLLIILFTLYFVPTIVAILRKAPDVGTVIVLNFFLGWTFLGWVLSLAMAARSQHTASINVNVSQQPGYGYAGVAYGPSQPAVATSYGTLPAGYPDQPGHLPPPAVQPDHVSRDGWAPQLPNQVPGAT